MPYDVSWLIPDRVIQVLPPTLGADDLMKDFDDDMMRRLDAAAEPIHILVDVRHVQVHPSTQAFINLRYFKHPNLGRLIMLGMSEKPLLRFMMSLATKGLQLSVVGFTTPEEVQTYLETLKVV